MPSKMNLNWGEALSVPSLLLSLCLGLLFALIIRWHFRKFGSTLTNREEFQNVFPLILLTTILIISVVKSSLALSLGLVGALSIVRFRTPIKEPEELAYLFLTIAMGLGFGASQMIATTVSGLFILMVMALLQWRETAVCEQGFFLSIRLSKSDGADESSFGPISELLKGECSTFNLRRMEVATEVIEFDFLVEFKSPEMFSKVIEKLKKEYPCCELTFLDSLTRPVL